jgi:hypothetical protein
MSYKRVQELGFSWSYEELLALPVFIREEIYRTLDEFLEEEKQIMEKAKNGVGF